MFMAAVIGLALGGVLGLLAVLVLRGLRRALRWRPVRYMVIDGSNVMYWGGGQPNFAPLHAAISWVKSMGYTPGVVFDANAGYLLTGKYLHHAAMGRRLGLPEQQILVVPKGTPADAFILAAAKDLGARIITNDRYRDWADEYPIVRQPGYLITGIFHDDQITLHD